jgi:hypothetical protein
MKHVKHQYHHDHSQHLINTPVVPMPEPTETKHQGVDFAPPEHEVAERAYYIFLNHGGHCGHDLDHWLEAEVELATEHNIALNGGMPALTGK